MIPFLEERKLLHERVNSGIDVHLSDSEADEFERLALEIDKNIHWQTKGCIDCVNRMVKFVFDKQGTMTRRETFPKADVKII